VLVRGVGHMSLPVHGSAVREIAATLAQLDAAGATVREGVIPIASDRPRTGGFGPAEADTPGQTGRSTGTTRGHSGGSA
jgi:hypothetical protein